MLKKIIRVLILISVIFSMFACNSSKKAVTEYDAETAFYKMDTIKFGSYPQTKNGGKKPIEWFILEKNEEEMLLFSKYILDIKYYEDSGNAVTWENCTLRQWLNSSFYDTAFSPDEKNKIIISTVENSSGNTNDYVYILSGGECCKYFGEAKNYKRENDTITSFWANKRLIAPVSKFALQKCIDIGKHSGDSYFAYEHNYELLDDDGFKKVISYNFWLRSPEKSDKITIVGLCGAIEDAFVGPNDVWKASKNSINGVRPVIRIKLK